MKQYKNIDEYISLFPSNVQLILTNLRNTIKSVSSELEETISYNMPAFKKKKVIVYFAAYKNHIGFYPHTEAIIVFKEELKKYKTSKGAIQFPINEELPYVLIKKIVLFNLDNIIDK